MQIESAIHPAPDQDVQESADRSAKDQRRQALPTDPDTGSRHELRVAKTYARTAADLPIQERQSLPTTRPRQRRR